MVENNCWDGIPMGPIFDEDFESILNNILDFPLENLDEEDLDDSLSQLVGPIPLDDQVFKPNNSVSFKSGIDVPVRRRSKRKRSSSANPWLLMAPLSSKKKIDTKKGKEKKRRKMLCAMDYNLVQKCSHCEITKTPQWREGPLGPKTLCNACGVRYRSGRLFPEYRPAASPTFIPSLHSNSHRKVIEMRRKAMTDPEICSSV